MASVTARALPPMVRPKCLQLSPSQSYSPHTVRIPSSHPQGLAASLSSSFISASSSGYLPFVFCGRGDKKTAKGKRFRHSYGNARPRNKNKGRGPPRIMMPSSPSKEIIDVGEPMNLDNGEPNM